MKYTLLLCFFTVISCRPSSSQDADAKSIVGLSADAEIVNSYDAFANLAKWFQCLRQTQDFSQIQSLDTCDNLALNNPFGDDNTSTTPVTNNTEISQRMQADLNQYAAQQNDRLSQFEKARDTGDVALLEELLTAETEEMHDIILVLLTSNHRIKTDDMLAAFVQNAERYYAIDEKSIKDEIADPYLRAVLKDGERSINSVIDGLEAQKKLYLEYLKGLYIEDGKKIRTAALDENIRKSKRSLNDLSSEQQFTLTTSFIFSLLDKLFGAFAKSAKAGEPAPSPSVTRDSGKPALTAQKTIPDQACDYRLGSDQACSEYQNVSGLNCQEAVDPVHCARVSTVRRGQFVEKKRAAFSKGAVSNEVLPSINMRAMNEISSNSRKQTRNGPCTAYGIVHALELAIAVQKDLSVAPDFDPLVLFKKYNSYNWLDASAAAETHQFVDGNTGEAYSLKKPRAVSWSDEEEDLREMERLINQGTMLWVATETSQAWQALRSSGRGSCTIDATNFTPYKNQADIAHAYAIIGYKRDPNDSSKGHWIIKNSWGSEWGCNGYAFLPYDYCNQRWCIADTVDPVL